MKIFYVHHAERNVIGKLSQSDTITKLGEKDASTMAETFARKQDKYAIKAIYTSPYLRCRQTTDILNAQLNLPVFEDARLNEFNWSENEKWSDCQKRIIACLKDIVNKYGEKDAVLCVTSGVNITAFIAAAYHIAPSDNLPYQSALT